MEITDLREIYWLLGIEIKKNKAKDMISLSQYSYINASLWKFGFEDTKPLSISIDLSTQLIFDQLSKSTTEIAYIAKIPYQEAIKKLIYSHRYMNRHYLYSLSFLILYKDTWWSLFGSSKMGFSLSQKNLQLIAHLWWLWRLTQKFY